VWRILLSQGNWRRQFIDASGAAAEAMRLLNDQLLTHPYSREWPFLSTEKFEAEKDVSSAEPRIGVYGCSCGGTTCNVLDMQNLVQNAVFSPM